MIERPPKSWKIFDVLFLNSMFVIDLDNNRVSETISTERHPIGITVDPETNLVYVVNEYADSISIFNPSFG